MKTDSGFHVVIHEEGNLFVATCPDIGTVSQGETLDIARANLEEATKLYLEEFPRSALNG